MNSIPNRPESPQPVNLIPGPSGPLDAALAQLRCLFESTAATLNLYMLPAKRSLSFPSQDLEAAAVDAVSLGSSGSNIYFEIGLQKKPPRPGERGKAREVVSLTAFAVDIDVAGGVHKAANLPPDIETALEIVGEFPLLPTMIVHSGGGLQVFHCFREPWDLHRPEEWAMAQDMSRRYFSAFDSLMRRRGYHLDNCSSLEHLFRVAGTQNWKTGSPVQVRLLHLDSARRYNLSEIDDWLLDAAKPAAAIAIEPPASNGRRVAVEKLIDWALRKVAAGEGRNNTGFNLAVQLRDNRFTYEEARDAMAEYQARVPATNTRGQAEPYSLGDAQINLDQAWSQPPREPWVSTDDAELIPLIAAQGSQAAEDSSAASWIVAPVEIDEILPHPDRSMVLRCLGQNEYGDARLFAHLYAQRVVFDHGTRAWYLWSGHAFRQDRSGVIKRLVGGQLAAEYLAVASSLAREAEAVKDADSDKARGLKRDEKALVVRALAVRGANRLRNILYQAESFLGITGDEWDRNPDLLGVVNGVVDLRSASCRSGRPEDYVRTQCPAEWQGLDAPAPQWERAVHEIFAGEEDVVAFFQRLLGYGITGNTTEHVLPVLEGPGRNGKDTILNTLQFVLGDVAGPVSDDVIVASKHSPQPGGASPHLIDLQGKRLVWVNETNEGARLNTGQVKWVTGGGLLKARPLYGKPVQFAPTHLVMLVTNNRPHAPGDDYALWKRILLIGFKTRFVDNPRRPNERQRDSQLFEKLKGEAPGILAWLVRGAYLWRTMGLNPPASVQAGTEEYRRDEDVLGRFIEDRCLEGAGQEVRAGALYKEYQDWAESNSIKNVMNGNNFGKKVSALYEKEHRKDGWYYLGISVMVTL